MISGPACREFDQIPMKRLGEIVYSKAIALSKKVNDDLLVPMARWIDDPGWVKKFQVIEDHIPNWSVYKRDQRHRTKRLNALVRERLMNYRQEIRRRRNYRKEISRLPGRIIRGSAFRTEINEDIISPVVSPFSPPERRKAETLHQFQQSRKASLADLLPWRLLLSSDLITAKPFSALKVYGHNKQDRAAKLIHLLHMETEGRIKISQMEPFSEIMIEPVDVVPSHHIMIKDQHSFKYFLEWENLNGNQRDKIIADIKANKILCRVV